LLLLLPQWKLFCSVAAVVVGYLVVVVVNVVVIIIVVAIIVTVVGYLVVVVASMETISSHSINSGSELTYIRSCQGFRSVYKIDSNKADKSLVLKRDYVTSKRYKTP
jgi:hypothetical protein